MKFVKMQATGNDYILIEDLPAGRACRQAGRQGLQRKVARPATLARSICQKHFGVGADGLILILAPSPKRLWRVGDKSRVADFRMRIFNPDGSEAEMCGNGIRCLAKLVYERKYTRKKKLAIETASGIRALRLFTRKGKVLRVEVNMGLPGLERDEIPMRGKGSPVLAEPVRALGKTFTAACLSMGNPHCVIFRKNIASFPLEKYGPAIENSPLFPQRTNVEFVKLLNRGEVEMRVWERGVGETLACGTGAAAVAVAGCLTGRTNRKIQIHPCLPAVPAGRRAGKVPGGDLEVDFRTDGCVYLTGAAEVVFEGQWLK
ncbi:MAG: hypothetical protein AMS15_03670 [Planctomycetes bacterium DG_23]|nr:MAG: hypothetical protein AMS15_03670 [Planctomycetes bacterium DG_23]